MEVSNDCYRLLKHYEGCLLKAYQCSAGKWTIGYGNTFYADGSAVKQGDTITQRDAEKLLPVVLEKFVKAVNKYCGKVAQHEFDALACFAYNIGLSAFCRSTLLKKIILKKPKAEISAEFHKWNKAGGKILNGLKKRRAAEAYLFEHGAVRIF